MGYVVGYSILAGLLSWFVLSCDAKEARDRGEAPDEAV